MALSKEEEAHRSALQDVATILVALRPLCESVDELLDVITLAVGDGGEVKGNDAQLRLLLSRVKGGRK